MTETGLVIGNKGIDHHLKVSGVYKIKGVGDVIAGRFQSTYGTFLKPNDEVVFYKKNPNVSNPEGKIFTIEIHHQKVAFARDGDSVGLVIKGLVKHNMPKVGDVLVLKGKENLESQVVHSFNAQIKVNPQHQGEITPGFSTSCVFQLVKFECMLEQIIEKTTFPQKKKIPKPQFIQANEKATVKILVLGDLKSPFVKSFNKNQDYGVFLFKNGSQDAEISNEKSAKLQSITETISLEKCVEWIEWKNTANCYTYLDLFHDNTNFRWGNKLFENDKNFEQSMFSGFVTGVNV